MTGSETLATLIALAQQLAGASRSTTIAELVGQAVLRLLEPDGLAVLLIDGAANTRRVAYTHNYATPGPDDPLVDLALHQSGILQREALARLAVARVPVPLSWMGAPIRGAAARTLGAISLFAGPNRRYLPPDLVVLNAILTSAAIALENARLLQLLSEGKREWEQTVDAISEAFCVVDRAGVVRRANRAFGMLAQRPLTTLAGRQWSTLLPESWVPSVTQVLAQPSTVVELPMAGRLFTVSALRIGSAEDRAVVLVFADQTEKRRLQEQLVQSEKMSAIGQLIAGVAHDLNNPLASVVGFADYLIESEDNAPPHLLEPLRAIQQEAERAANIVRNLLSFARKQDRRRRSQQIGPVLEATLLLLRNQLMACKVESHLTIDPSLPEVTIEANQIQQVFVNLINNAAQAIQGTHGMGNVWVHASRWLDGVAVTIEDDGPGVPQAIQAKVFEPFFTTKPEGQGTGLGLSICHGIVAEHGGRITLGRRTGGGAAFRVELPGGTAPEERPVAAVSAETGKLRVLVVDDEPHILHYMQATLEAWGHTVTLAADGDEALARARSELFDVIITDVRMPHLGGREFFETLEKERPDVAKRVVFSTGDTVRGDTLAFLESLGRPFLHKPFSLAELRSALASTLRP
ncbi:MAG: response regulator [Gemmatimonadetes bacterium]|nr:response regulator [Gemmatimonadota bacterium]